MTVLEVLNSATAYLAKHGVDSPRLNAELLLAHCLKKKRLDLYLEFDRDLSDAERAPLRELVRDRGQRRPLQHLLGTTEFYGREFLSDPRALIPRPETEQLIDLILTHAKNARSALDVGTGSGIIAITLALELPAAKVTAVDISSEALALASSNAERLGASILFEETDLFPTPDKFDLIAANLPYIPSGEIPSLQAEVQHDPRLALDGGGSGLEIIHRLIVSLPQYLESGGWVILEVGQHQASQVKSLFDSTNFTEIASHLDYQGVERFVSARKS